MKREVVTLTSTVVLSTILVFCFQSTAVQAAALKTGSPCKKLGATQLNKVDTYKCVLRNKKHVWTIAYRAPIAKSPQPLPLTPTYSCTSAPDVPAITVTAATLSDGPTFTITVSNVGSLPSSLVYLYNYFDSTSNAWDNWSSTITQTATFGTSLTFVSPQPAGKTFVGLNAYSTNACGSSPIVWDNVARTGTALIPIPTITQNLTQITDPNYPNGYPVGTAGVALSTVVSESSPASLSATSQTPTICAINANDLILNFIAPGSCILDVKSQSSSTLTSAEVYVNLTVVSNAPTSSCGVTPTENWNVPGWVAGDAQITSSWVGTGTLLVSWCAASVGSTGPGSGPIIYTVTLDPGANTCTTSTSTSCEISGLSGQTANINLIASNKQGTFSEGVTTIANTGEIFLCTTGSPDCNPGPVDNVYQAYGNTSAGLGDCTFAAAADWEQIMYGTSPDAATIVAAFFEAGGSTSTGLTAGDLFKYWQTSGIASVKASTVHKYYTDQIDVENGVNSYKAVLASLTLVPGQNIAGQTTLGGGHMIVVDGYTPEGPVIVTWGLTMQMTWQQWNLEVVGMWGINN